MPARKSAPEIPALTSELQLLQLVADPAVMAAALPIVRERLRLTPEKLALILIRLINPDEDIGQVEESKLRGVRPETLKGYKEEKLLPRLINGAIPTVVNAK